MKEEAFSVIVTAYNNGDTLSPCLDTLIGQTRRPKELIVVVDTSSRDNTQSVVGGFAATGDVKIVECSEVGRSLARNIGWRSASGDVIMFADGDDTYDPDYVEKASECLRLNPSLGGVCVGGAPLNLGDGLLMRYYASVGETDTRMTDKEGGPEWAFVYKKESLQEVGGFDETLSQAEDRDLCSRVKKSGYTIGYVPGVHWRHRKPATLRQFLSKRYHSGIRRVAYVSKHKRGSSLTRSLIPSLSVIPLVLLGLLSPLTLLLVILFGYLAYAVALRVKTGRKSDRIIDFFAFPLMALGGRLSESVGSVVGLFELGFRRSGTP
jgi:GT2 family glycosyltransferase